MQGLTDFLSSISLTNMADIGIMALLVYFVLSWFRGTRAFQIAATLLAIGVFYFLASAAGLVLSSLLLQYLWAAIIVVLVIVFQPEIREMLDRASPLRYLLNRQHGDLRPDVVDEIVRAVADLARLKIGALIVFQRMDRLDNLVLKGKTLDMKLSAEALVMIFQKGSPLHDGAVLISKETIHAAGCILPLSRSESIDPQYGTRHRAALGLTERSDALCAVVSEERGQVSLVEASTITNYEKKGEFREALEQRLHLGGASEPTPDSPTGLTGLLANWHLKLVALACAVVLWFVIVGPQRSEIGMAVPIQYTNLPATMEIIGTWMDRIDVRVRGSQSGLASLNPGSVRAVVDLSSVVPGLNYFRITAKNLQVPPGISIAQIRPSDLQLNIEVASSRKMAIVPNILGALPEMSRVVVEPSEATLRAVMGDLKKVTSLTTDPINATDLVAKGKVISTVQVKPDGVRLESVDPVQVTVTLRPESP
jgi:uncharacterized protein (TIGR00159 family)